ncbi:MAG: thiamine ABC transporter substrate-binding protein [Sphaerochaeta sp.]|nr:thiamine ABC transporter substrate-binding protein [Sphaerochaeta sp.]MDX9915151.1 thiamine ABC transporter substrate-binding protein [Sphaerochaeta sp.]
MKQHRAFCVMVAIILLLFPIFAQGRAERQEPLVVYAYDAFTGDWGPGPALVAEYEARFGTAIKLVGSGDAISMMNRLMAEGKSTPADVVVGITDDMAGRILDSALLRPYQSPQLEHIPSFLHFDPTWRLLPFDYGNYAFIVDSEKLQRPLWPSTLSDLTDTRFKDKIILIDPRTSSVGLGLLLWTIEEYGPEHWLSWWEAIKPNVLTITDGWSSAYGLFTEGEAPLVISFTTSPVYHVLNEGSTRYQALIFPSGHQATIEGVGILASSTRQEEAERFVDFLLSDAQEEIAIANSMYPTNASTELPAAFQWAPKPPQSLSTDRTRLEKNLERWLTEWTEVMSR